MLFCTRYPLAERYASRSSLLLASSAFCSRFSFDSTYFRRRFSILICRTFFMIRRKCALSAADNLVTRVFRVLAMNATVRSAVTRIN